MRSVLERLADTDEAGLVAWGQSNRRPWGDRDKEGFLAAPHLALRAAGQDLCILAIANALNDNPQAGVALGQAGSQAIVTVAEELRIDDWVGGELRLVAHDWSEPLVNTNSTVRKGHANVLRCSPSATATVTFDLVSDRVLWVSHGRRDGSQVQFKTTGALPGLTAGEVLFVRDATEHTFRVARTPWGAAVDLIGGAGTHTCTARPCLLVQWTSAAGALATATFTAGPPGVVNHANHNLTSGSAIAFSGGGAIPPQLTPHQPYYVHTVLSDGTYTIASTIGGTELAFDTNGGVAGAMLRCLANLAGYVHARDRWKTYDNVLMVVPFQPIEPGPYPTDPPVVPGVTLRPDVVRHEDLALVLPFSWQEGIEGHGAVGTVQVAGLVCTLQGGQLIDDGIYADGFIRVAGSKGEVASNTTTTVTVKAWVGGQPAVATNLAFHLHLPHWRNNPHHYTAGEGFLYPPDDMQPGGIGFDGAASEGVIYSRPRGRLRGCYVGRDPVLAVPVSVAVNALAVASTATTAAAQMTVALGTGADSGTLKVAWTITTHDPATGVLPFETFLRPGYLVQLGGMGQTPSVDGIYRVVRMQRTTANGSEVYLAPYDATLTPLPGAVAGVVPKSASVARLSWKPRHRFGSIVDTAWRLANGLGRRVIVTLLGINSSSQTLRNENLSYSYQGRIGWFDDDLSYDWTPSDPTGLAARLRRLIEFIGPRAVQASLGINQTLRQLAIDGYQMESDSILSPAQRELAFRTASTFIAWLRGVIVKAGQSPYPKDARVPFQWAQLTHDPWELPSLPVSTTSYTGTVAGDVDGLVNAALRRLAALDGFGASIDTNDSPKVATDSAHFNGYGMARNARLAAEALSRLIEQAFAFGFDQDMVEAAIEALQLLGETPNVPSLDVPTTTHARVAAPIMREARRFVLQAHQWSFATKRAAGLEIVSASSAWQYAYGVPADLLKPLLALDPEAASDMQVVETMLRRLAVGLRASDVTNAKVAPADYSLETEDGFRVLRTNQANAVLVYTSATVELRNWAPMARKALIYHAAHQLAGVLLKGKTGAAVSQQLLQMSLGLIAQARADDAQFGRDVTPPPSCPWLPEQ